MKTKETNSKGRTVTVEWELCKPFDKTDDYCRDWSVNGTDSNNAKWEGFASVCSDSWDKVIDVEQITLGYNPANKHYPKGNNLTPPKKKRK